MAGRRKTKERLSPIPKPRRAKPEASANGNGAGKAPRAPADDAGPDLSRIAEDLRGSVMPLPELAFMVGNPMMHPEDQIEELRASLREFGQVLPLIVNTAKSPPEIVGGNGRLSAMLAEGWTHGAVVRRELTDAKARALAITLNASQSDQWDKRLLAEMMGQDLNTGNDPRLDAMMAELAESVGIVPGMDGNGGKDDEPSAIELNDDDNPEAEFLAPFPWFGGKSRVARLAWKAFGDVPNFIEPFFGSGAVLLGRPLPFDGTETINDYDGLVANFWRAVQADPDAVAKHADWPANECVPSGTMIATPNGEIPVEDVREGVAVWGERDGQVVETTVIATRTTESSAPFVRVGPLMLTGNHPVWTLENGYVEARALQSRLHVAMICTHDTAGSMCGMQKDVPPASAGRDLLFNGLQWDGQAVSREAVCYVRNDVSCAAWEYHPAMLLAELRASLCVEAQPREDAAKCGQGEGGIAVEQGSPSETCRMAAFARKSDLRSRREAQVECLTKGSRLCVTEPSWDKKAKATDRASTDAACAITGLGIGADRQDLRFSGQNTRRQTESASALLVSAGHRRSGVENSRRSGRSFSSEPENKRPTEGRHFDRIGMASLEVQQPPNSDKSRQGCSGDRSRTVHNFQTVTGNYFANGILVHNCDLHARHSWLVGQKESLQAKLEGDHEYFDAKIAGFWVWGMACWIGSGFCSGKGPWRVVEAEDGTRQLVHLGDAGRGVNRQLVHLGDAGMGDEPQARAGRGECGLLAWMRALSDRLKRVRVCCGDWTRVCGGDSGDALKHFFASGQSCGVFLDPPYADTAGRDEALYRVDSQSVAHAVREWAIKHGDDKRLRIILCGYEGEHEMPGSWRVVRWKAHGGYGNQGDGSRGQENAYRERLWLSPHCLEIAGAKPVEAEQPAAATPSQPAPAKKRGRKAA